MVSCDTNILFAASCPDDPKHAAACAFLEAHADDGNFVVAEQTLVELYCLLAIRFCRRIHFPQAMRQQ